MVKFAPKIVPDLGVGLDHVVKITGISDDHAKAARCEAALGITDEMPAAYSKRVSTNDSAESVPALV